MCVQGGCCHWIPYVCTPCLRPPYLPYTICASDSICASDHHVQGTFLAAIVMAAVITSCGAQNVSGNSVSVFESVSGSNASAVTSTLTPGARGVSSTIANGRDQAIGSTSDANGEGPDRAPPVMMGIETNGGSAPVAPVLSPPPTGPADDGGFLTQNLESTRNCMPSIN